MKGTKMQKGITLIALIITIIVLLVLAVVAISAIQDSGILLHADRSAIIHEVGTISEKVRLESQALKLAGAASPDNAIAQTGANALKSIYARYDNEEYAAVELKTIKLDENGTESIPEITDFTKDYYVVIPEKLNYDISRGKNVDIANLRTEDIFVVDNEFNVYYLTTVTIKTAGGGDEEFGWKPVDESEIPPKQEGKIYAIEDLLDLALTADSFAGKTITLERTLDFTKRESYRKPDDTTTYGDINGDDKTEGIMVELTTGTGFMPIGMNIGTDANGNQTIFAFQGEFDGQNNTIYNFYMARGGGGLFGYVGPGATIKNLGLTGSNSGEIVGGIVGIAFSMTPGEQPSINIQNCHVKDFTITDGDSAAAITGYVMAMCDYNVEGCTVGSNTDISANDAAGICNVGMGKNVTIKNCKNSANISGSTIGGILHSDSEGGDLDTIYIENCTNLESVLSATGNAAGIACISYSEEILDSFECINSHNYATIEPMIDTSDSKNTDSSMSLAAGACLIQGAKITNIQNCNNYGDISGVEDASGVFAFDIDSADGDNEEITISNCNNEGNITSSKNFSNCSINRNRICCR